MKQWNVIFLLDQNPPSEIVMLKRAATKTFAPNFYTGVGGKVEEGETLLQSAYRELQEETGIVDITLKEFARCIIDTEGSLHYFWGIYDHPLPQTDDGTLEWVPTFQVDKKDIIPTTKEVCREWQKRGFAIDQPFTLFVKESGKDRGIILTEIDRIEEGLPDND